MHGEKITNQLGKITVPDFPIVPFIEGDGTGPDIWAASVRVLDDPTKLKCSEFGTAIIENM
jgi:isocitrate dehydrogenase